jgi:hypothetical protein
VAFSRVRQWPGATLPIAQLQPMLDLEAFESIIMPASQRGMLVLRLAGWLAAELTHAASQPAIIGSVGLVKRLQRHAVSALRCVASYLLPHAQCCIILGSLVSGDFSKSLLGIAHGGAAPLAFRGNASDKPFS